ncbi:c8d74735-8f58-4597-97c4-779b7117073a [Thermothielavioides terrestris]|uniref:C8d74735-8f58-4597-97c4-779b7117073a n=1 Tax=Thermothielavioides terrestris TaxID=2587410 RepID=A0A3S5CXI5_9PEZI|nr:c8d74735-8f58-4597-97c4-779b7117073a [Thermothielavioides terrestris]
MNFVSPFD